MQPLKTCVATLFVLLVTGCEGPDTQAPPTAANTPSESAPDEPPTIDGMTALEIMQKLIETYREANTYMDSGEYGTHFVSAEDGVQRQGLPMTFSLVYEKPNRFRVAREELAMEANGLGVIVACDGQQLEASVSRLEPQRLVVEAPEKATPASIAPDPLLREALLPRPARDIFPQLDLLLLEANQTPWVLEAPTGLLLLTCKPLARSGQPPVDCFRVRVATEAGPHTCWIDRSSYLLLRIDIENDEIARELYPDQDFLSFQWRFDFYDPTIDAEIPEKLFRIQPSAEQADAEVVTAFRKLDGSGDQPANGGAELPGNTESNQE